MSLFRVVALAAFVSVAPIGVSHVLAQVAPPVASSISPETVSVPASQGRTFELKIWRAANERAVIVFDPGGGGRPAGYQRMLSALAAKGFTVIAPVHVDGLARGDLSGTNGPDSFSGRVESLAIARGYAKATHPGRPLVAAGHSFGTMMSLISVGAVTPAGPQADPDIKAVIAFSSPGVIQGLMNRDSYARVATPTLLITGDADVVPGFVTDWRDHRAAFDTSKPGDKMLLVFEGGGHDLVATADAADFELMVETTTAFVEAYALGSKPALEKLRAMKPVPGVSVERR